MSSMLPPSEPPRWPGGPGPSTPRPVEHPVVTTPPAEPETPVVVETTGAQGGRGLVYGLVGGGVAAVVAVGAAGMWAWAAVGGGGDRPAAALPGSTFVYAAVDLDPAAGQKIEAFRTLNRFPAFSEAGVEDDGELSGSFWDSLFEGDSCANFDAATDVSPWLGKRAAFAGVSLEGDVVPVGVVQVTDDEAAPAGLATLRACSENGDADTAGDVEASWVIRDGWAYVAKDAETAGRVADAAASGTSLADSVDFESWMDRIGDQGIVTMWVAPKPGQKAAALLEQLTETGAAVPQDELDVLAAQYDTFQGGAATLRFADGGLELSSAMGLEPDARDALGDGIGSSVASLPDDTLAAYGVSTAPGWVSSQVDDLAQQSGGEIDPDEVFGMIEAQTGLTMPEDLETLVGRGVVLSLGGDLDTGVFTGDADPTAVPVAAKVTGDPDAVERVVGTVAALDPSIEQILGTTRSGDDTVVIGPDQGYREQVAAGGSLGDSERFRAVVPHADDAVMAFYLDVDGAGDWLVDLAKDDEEAAANLAPLAAVGMSAWLEDEDVLRFTVRASTD